MKVYSINVRNRFTASLLAIAVLGLGAALLVVGFALLAGLAIAGGVLGTGYAIYHRLRGTRPALGGATVWRDPALDPALEVFPDRLAGTLRVIEPGTKNDM